MKIRVVLMRETLTKCDSFVVWYTAVWLRREKNK